MKKLIAVFAIVLGFFIFAPHANAAESHTVTGGGHVNPGQCWNTTFTFDAANDAIVKEEASWCPNGYHKGFSNLILVQNTEHHGINGYVYCNGPEDVSGGLYNNNWQFHWGGDWFFRRPGTSCGQYSGREVWVNFTLNDSGDYTYKYNSSDYS